MIPQKTSLIPNVAKEFEEKLKEAERERAANYCWNTMGAGNRSSLQAARIDKYDVLDLLTAGTLCSSQIGDKFMHVIEIQYGIKGCQSISRQTLNQYQLVEFFCLFGV